MAKKKNSGAISTVMLVILLLVGLSVMLYPTVSDWWNSKVQSRAIATYQSAVGELTETDYSRIFAQAEEYNRALAAIASPLIDYDRVAGYEDILDITGTGIMGYITIPQIRVQLPIYHGTSASVLNVAVGHLQGSSLPVGGEETHAVISAHRGLPSATLFSDLDQLVEGDTFTITILDRTFTYEVDRISIVEPQQTEQLAILAGEDLVTLTTCTPYGINSHRLLVRAHRVENAVIAEQARVTADAVQVDSMQVVPYVAAPILLLLILYWIFGGKKKKKFSGGDLLRGLPEESRTYKRR